MLPSVAGPNFKLILTNTSKKVEIASMAMKVASSILFVVFIFFQFFLFSEEAY